MKKMYAFVLLLASFVSVQAQTKNDPEAKKVLDAVSAKFRTFKSPSATFTYQVENAQGKVLSSKKGQVNMKGNKYKVTMGGLEIFSDGRTSWNFDKGANEVTVSGVDLGSSAMTPQKLFTNFYDRDFLYKMNGEKKVAGKAVQEVELTPTDKSKPFHKVYVLVDKANKTIYSARFLEKSGNRYSYTINSLAPNAAVTDAAFVFDKKKYPGVEVVDLR
ncbi:Outer membrane lipoprotein-sorting protein [Cnuella takakiae]|uniref:Outer membrane lipoprotein-sorting protein n=1 Tax=Cnuella takakiae TaxID=1302690 RepID=A0A1M5HH52_9BACT|nr:outer membrane lipoprotein carrier protein LolA [Cnuella takakiae]OLY92867.1 lipoprotein carrier protein LolA [Cnuella takakiae]SHG15208.1 Outer membrane lipoprotein-sorting protein [Cnuella takakiae]